MGCKQAEPENKTKKIIISIDRDKRKRYSPKTVDFGAVYNELKYIK